MQATTQPLPEVVSFALDLNPPVRGESIDLSILTNNPVASQASVFGDSTVLTDDVCLVAPEL